MRWPAAIGERPASAIERKEFKVYYQPIIDLQTDEVSGFEALVRWYTPSGALFAPINSFPSRKDWIDT